MTAEIIYRIREKKKLIKIKKLFRNKTIRPIKTIIKNINKKDISKHLLI
jgi:hypothetical protein